MMYLAMQTVYFTHDHSHVKGSFFWVQGGVTSVHSGRYKKRLDSDCLILLICPKLAFVLSKYMNCKQYMEAKTYLTYMRLFQ